MQHQYQVDDHPDYPRWELVSCKHCYRTWEVHKSDMANGWKAEEPCDNDRTWKAVAAQRQQQDAKG